MKIERVSHRGALLGLAGVAAGSFAAASLSNAFSTPPLPPTTAGVSPFSVRIPQAQLVDLKRRLAATRFQQSKLFAEEMRNAFKSRRG
jgi:hypothetical protein